jgi:hypothetical protein
VAVDRRIERAADGAITVRLPPEERAFLQRVCAELEELLVEAPDDPGLRRLFPPAYDDEQDERTYRDLMGDELTNGRRRALETLAATVDAERLTGEQAEAWLRGLNDLRLVIGTRAEVEEDTLLEGIRPDDPRALSLELYAYLSWLQEQLVEALSGDLPG